MEEADFPDLVGADEVGGVMDEFALLQEEDIVYSAAKHKQDIAESPSAITLITREQIENTACLDVICLLRQVPEMDVMLHSPSFVAAGARAMTSETGDKLLLLLDGVECSEAVFSAPLWQVLPIHLEDIERIEVIRGPGSALYGPNAFAAIVSITTRKTDQNHAEAFIGAGERDSLSLHLRLNQELGDWRLNISGGRQTNDHWRIRDKRDREINWVRLRLARRTDSSTSVIQADIVTTQFDIFTKLGLVKSRGAPILGHLLFSHQTDLLKAQAYFRTSHADLSMNIPLHYGDLELGKLPEEITFLSTTLDLEVQLNWSPWENNLLVAGSNYRWVTFLSEDNLPEETHNHRVGVYIQDEQRVFETLMLNCAVRLDYNNISPMAISPRLAAVWEFSKNNNLRLAFGKAFLRPPIMTTSLHFKNVKGISGIEDFFERSIGNRDLDNEKITTFEIGYIGHFSHRRFTAEADVFYISHRDTSAFVVDIATNELGAPDLSQSVMEFRSEGLDVNSVGGSISLTFHIREIVYLNTNYTFRHSWYHSTPGDYAGTLAGLKKGDRVPWEPAHLFNVSAHYIPNKGPRFGLSLHAESLFDLPWTEDGSPFGTPVSLHRPPYCFVSGFLAWRQPSSGSQWWELGLRAYNVLSAGFRDYPAVVQRDGSELGGQLVGRRIFLFLRASTR